MTSRKSRPAMHREGFDATAAIPILTFRIQTEADIVGARQRARHIGALLGYDVQHQTHLATAVSEIVRNAFHYAGGGRIDFAIEGQTSPQLFVIRVVDSGPGIRDLEAILEGRYQSPTGMGLGILGARRLMDQFHIESTPGAGAAVTMIKLLPRRAPLITPRTLPPLLEELACGKPESALDEMQRQNRELLATLTELVARQDDLVRLNHELEDTNRGVVALYAELDEKADHLRRAVETKSSFLSHLSHEFRTPLNSILALTRLLLDRVDGELSTDQERQVFFIRKSAESLSELVNDLLDLAKVEAGKITLHPAEIDVKNMFGALRGMLRPLLLNPAVNLIFDPPEDLPVIVSDEAKVSQILRNLISNALKFTEHGEVRVSARRDGDRVIFSVADTGIGIPPGDLERIFQEFIQLESPIQCTVKGTGLGLPLSRTLAGLLGGSVNVTSRPTVGSTFSLAIPAVYAGFPQPGASQTTRAMGETQVGEPQIGEPQSGPTVENGAQEPILVVDDDDAARLLYEDYVKGTEYYIIPARTIGEARAVLATIRPRAIVLDLLLAGADEDGVALLAELKGREVTKAIPVLVISCVKDPRKVYSLGGDRYALKPASKEWFLQALSQESLEQCTHPRVESGCVLLVDDDGAFRYLVKHLFAGVPQKFVEAADGVAGLEAARQQHPELIFLDLMMPRMNGFEMLEQLRSDPETRDIPVIVSSSRALSQSERGMLEGLGAAILSKDRFADGDAVPAVHEILAGIGLGGLLRTADS